MYAVRLLVCNPLAAIFTTFRCTLDFVAAGPTNYLPDCMRLNFASATLLHKNGRLLWQLLQFQILIVATSW